MARKIKQEPLRFEEYLILFKYFLRVIGIDRLADLGKRLNSHEYEGRNQNGYTYFVEEIILLTQIKGVAINEDKLRRYDENICRHTDIIGAKRGGVKWKYFQYISLLFTEMYLDSYFKDVNAFCDSLNDFRTQLETESLGRVCFEPFTPEKLNKVAFMSATGSGKTLIMHVNILQYIHYFKLAKRMNSRLSLNKIIVLTPNEGMSKQHLGDLLESSFSAALFEKDTGFGNHREDVVVIDINKLKDDSKVKTVAVDSFEQNNLVLVDEGHRGLSGNIWYEYRSKLSAEGFAFEYSATFKQALKPESSKKSDRDLMEEYGKSIIMDYSYKYFYSDGYGKDYRIYNLREAFEESHKRVYLTGCLMSFYQQLKLFEVKNDEYKPFSIEKPLLIFVGNRVNNSTKNEDLTDVEEVICFLDNLIKNKRETIADLNAVMNDQTGLVAGNDAHDLFYRDFEPLRVILNQPDGELLYSDLLKYIFNCESSSDSPRLHLDLLSQVSGEIGLKVGEYGEYFGVINVGEPAKLIKSLKESHDDIVTHTNEFKSDSLFEAINKRNSNINILIGSRKFTEGWNSWRVSTMGLINFAKGKGSQAIQLFGRGVRLKGYLGCLKRTNQLDYSNVTIPQYIQKLETLTIFGIKAQYMEEFKSYLEEEGAPTESKPVVVNLPVIKRYDESSKKLKVIRVKKGISFKKQARRLILDAPDEEFTRYLLKSKTVIDCRSKIQTIESQDSFHIISESEEHSLPKEAIRYMDYQHIFEALVEYKNEKGYYNICIEKDRLADILSADGWYALKIPQKHLEIDSVQKLFAAEDYAVMVLKSYIDKFFRFEKSKWEAPFLEYRELEEDDDNFFDDYSFQYIPENSMDKTGEELENFINRLTALMNSNQGLDEYEKSGVHNKLRFFDFRNHLYAPLISLEKSSLKIQISPVSLNEGEKQLVDYLYLYVQSKPGILYGKGLYLLRNKSKRGMGFFEAGNFYPDYILWIDTDDTQYITFIDPKGLLHFNPDDPKVEFYRTIKDIESRMAPTNSGSKNIILNSFIMSTTKYPQLRERWGMTLPQLESHNVYTLDNSECVERMIGKILNPLM